MTNKGEGAKMRRILSILLCLSMLVFPSARAEEAKYVALTFDDGPSGRFTRRLLQGLDERDVQATFLLCGYRLKLYPELARQIFHAGHEIGLHGYSHATMQKMCERDVTQELERTMALIPTGCEVSFLRPPGGL